ncbi:MAG: hypothetical protein D6728_09995 [Cyanobacteria bacterium J055]|nr:MAG: hypothetical protein D6728_09995 [Cyanobacteria bacterium J055]
MYPSLQSASDREIAKFVGLVLLKLERSPMSEVSLLERGLTVKILDRLVFAGIVKLISSEAIANLKIL